MRLYVRRSESISNAPSSNLISNSDNTEKLIGFCMPIIIENLSRSNNLFGGSHRVKPNC